jgi:hypothetical protein
MPLSIFNINKSLKKTRDASGWTNQELAEFYRISDIMRKSGLVVDMERGLSDEGEPWTVFLKPDSEDVIAHFARIDGEFLSISSVDNVIYKGNDVRSVVNQMLRLHPLMIPDQNKNGNVYLHPGVVLTAFVAAAFLLSSNDASAGDFESVDLTALHGGENVGNSKYLDEKNGASSTINRNSIIEDHTSSGQSLLLGAVILAYNTFGATNEVVSADATSLLEFSFEVNQLPSLIDAPEVIIKHDYGRGSSVEESEVYRATLLDFTNARMIQKKDKLGEGTNSDDVLGRLSLITENSLPLDPRPIVSEEMETEFNNFYLVTAENIILGPKGVK